MSNTSFQYLGEQKRPDPDIRQIYINDPCHFKAQRGTSHEMSPVHSHNYTQLWYVLHGTFRHVFNGKDFYQSKGDFLIVPSYCTHQIDTSRSAPDVRFIFCDLAEDFLNFFPESSEKNTLFNLAYLRPLFINAGQMKPFLSFRGEMAKNIEHLFMSLWAEYQKNDMSPVYIRSNLIKMLTLIAKEYEKNESVEDDALYAKYRSAIQDALHYIDAHYTGNITLREVSKIALMSVSSFSSVFKQITGKSLIDYVHCLRIHKAQELLTDPALSMTQICYDCGFYDTPYFDRVFKKVTGYPPGAYRKKISAS